MCPFAVSGLGLRAAKAALAASTVLQSWDSEHPRQPSRSAMQRTCHAAQCVDRDKAPADADLQSYFLQVLLLPCCCHVIRCMQNAASCQLLHLTQGHGGMQ